LHHEISGSFSFEDTSGIQAREVIGVFDIAAITHCATGYDEVAILIDCSDTQFQ
jgi:hypothetical protein